MTANLQTERLVLRRPTPADAAAYIAYYGSEWRAAHGPVMQPALARRRFGRILDHWTTKGYGRFVVERKDAPGAIGLFGPHWPDSYPEREITGALWAPEMAGKGYGLEALRGVLAHAYDDLGWDTAVTYIHPENHAAERMARAVGARIDPTVHAPASLDGHEAWRHVSPAERSAGIAAEVRRKVARPRKPAAPTLKTRRLSLRPYRIEDFEPYAAFLASERSRCMHGPYPRKAAWQRFTNDIAHWSLFGYGGLMIDHRGRTVGQVGITSGLHFPEPELCFFLYDGHEGNGYATEAATAMRLFAYENAGLETLVSYVAVATDAAEAMARRLGCTRDDAALRPETCADCRVFRHPSPESDGSPEAYA